MRIAEIYTSRQGEGLLTGTPSIFVRASGCNLRCWFCDTPYASWQPEGEDCAVEEVLLEVERLGNVHDAPRHVVITGGEPMLFSELIPICDGLHAAGFHITIETAGTLFLPVKCDLMSISPKLAGSTPSADIAGKWRERHELTRHQPAVMSRLIRDYNHQLKFVVDCPADLTDIQAWLEEFSPIAPGRILLMPQGTDREGLTRIAEWLEPYCRERGYVFCPRRHIEWYGATRGT